MYVMASKLVLCKALTNQIIALQIRISLEYGVQPTVESLKYELTGYFFIVCLHSKFMPFDEVKIQECLYLISVLEIINLYEMSCNNFVEINRIVYWRITSDKLKK